MAYIINNFNGSFLTTVPDGSLDNTTDLTLVGSNFSGYGTIQNDNFLFLLENFASGTSPSKPIPGQLWYDSATNKLKLYDSSLQWRGISGADTSPNFPTNLGEGDLWFDTLNKELYVYSLSANNSNTPGYVLIGPPAADANSTKFEFVTVVDTVGQTHEIIKASTGSSTVFVVSNDSAFELKESLNAINGFTTIQQGITLCDTHNAALPGFTSSNHRFWGVAKVAEKIIVEDAGTDTICPATISPPSGANKTSVVVRDVNGNISGVSSNSDSLKALDGNDTSKYLTGDTEATPSTIVARDSLAQIKASQFVGTADKADKLKLGSNYVSAVSDNDTASTIVARDSSGDITVHVMNGTATAARYADLAEKYLADDDYEVGTVIMVGGEKEVTAALIDNRPIGVISAKPGFMMNKELEGGVYIALKGRVPVKVQGPVKKGDRLTSSYEAGVAVIGSDLSSFAVSLETNDDPKIKTIEAVIL